jgi:hypothetical protein
MNPDKVGIDFVTSDEVSFFGSEFANLISDSDADLAAITYRSITGQAYDPELGQQTNTYSDQTMNAVRRVLSLEEIARGNGAYQRGDVAFYVHGVYFLSTTPKVGDAVKGPGADEIWDIIEVERAAFAVCWKLICRRTKE